MGERGAEGPQLEEAAKEIEIEELPVFGMSEGGIAVSGAGESNIPAGVREIITKSFGSHSWDHSELKDRMKSFAEERLKEENKLLKSELDRMEHLLANVVSERDDIAIKYSDMSGRFESTLRTIHGRSNIGNNADSSDDTETSGGSVSLLRQNAELRKTLSEEKLDYKRKLQAYQESQQKHVLLVEKLQTKVLQYKKRCTELEETMRELNLRSASNQKPLLELQRNHVEQSREFEQLLRRVDEEVHRANNLVHINEMLQEQLNQSNASNKALNSEVQRLSNLVRDLEMKQYDWGKDKQLQDEFHMSNHQKLMSLWKAVSSLRKNFDSVRTATDRDVANMTSEMSRISRMTQNACLGLSKNSKNLELENEKERMDKEEMKCRLDKKNEELHQLREELTSLHSQKHERSRELNHEIERLKTMISEKDDSIVLLKMKLSAIENQVEAYEKVAKNSGGRRHRLGETRKSRNGLSKSIDHLNSCGSEESEEEHSKSDPDAQHGRKSTQNNSRSHSTSPVRHHGNQNSNNGNNDLNSYYQSGKVKRLDSPLEVFQSMIHKKQMEVLDLKSRLLNLSDQNYHLTRRVEDLNAERNEVRRSLETMEEEKRKLMANHSQLENSHEDIKMALDQSKFEVERLDGLRKSLMKQLEGANEDNRKLLSNNTELQRSKDSLNDEKAELLNEKERLMKEKERNHASLEQSEENIVKLKEELVGLKEHLHKTSLRLELLEQEKKDLENALIKTTQLKGELELNLSKHQHECAALREAVMRLQSLHEDIGNDNVDLKMYLKKLEGERSTLMLEKSELEQEKNNMRDVLNQLESDKNDLEAQNSSLEYGNRVLKESKEKLENDFHLLMDENKKNVERTEAALKQKMEVTEECSSAKMDLERQNELLMKLGKDKEELAKEKMDLILQSTNLERDVRRLNEEAINLKLDKERLEMQCDELHSEILGLEEKASRLEGINHELELKLENLNDEVTRLTQEVDVSMEKNEALKKVMEERLCEKDAAYQEMMKQFKSTLDGNIDKMSQEKDQMREHFEREYTDLCKRFSDEKSEILTKLEREKEKMKEEISAVKQIKEQQLLTAENEKQELINNNEVDRTKLLEKISAQQRDVMNIQNSFGKLKKELESKCCQQENTISLLESELKMAKTTLNKARNSFEKESKGLSNHLEMLASCKADLEIELSDLKAQLKTAMEAKDVLKNELNEAHSSITKIESDKEVTRKENLNLLRSLKEETCEKEMSHKLINDLKNAIKKLETEKLDLNRMILDAKQQLTGITEQKVGAQKEAFDLKEALKEVDKSRLEVKKELQETRRQLKTLEMEKLKLNHEVADHMSKLERNSGKMEEMKKEILSLKQKVMEVDDTKEILKKENSQLSRRLAGSEKEAELKGEELKQLEEDSNRIETRRNEEKFRLEAALENFHQKYSDLEVKHKNSESLVKHFQEKLTSLEAEKTDLEAKLTSLLTTIMRNFDQDASKFRTRNHSISRKGGRSTSSDGVQFGTRKRNRSHSPGRVNLSDVDIEDVKLMLRDCAQNAVDTERERDEAFSKLEMTQSKLTDMLVNQERLVSKLELVTGSLEDSDKLKRELENKIVVLQSKCMQYEDVLKKEERDNRQLAERVANLEMSLRSLDKERMQFQDKINDLKNSEMKLEEEKKHLKQIIEDGEKKIGMSESAKRILEGELYRMKMALNDKETEHQVACARMDQLLRQIEDLEVRAQSYQTTIDRLNSALIRCSEEKTTQKDQMSVLNMSLSDKSNTVNSLQERLAQLHRTLACSEQDRRTLQETLENSRHSLGEAKRQIQHLQERIENTQIEMKNKESRLVELEAQSKMSQNVHARHLDEERYLNEQIDMLHVEKQNLHEMVVKLQKTLAAMEADVRDAEVSTVKLKKDKTSLKRSLNKSEEFLNKTAVEKSQMDRMLKKLEEDNFDLLHRIQSLQLQLTTAEQENRQRLLEMAARHREETDLELERLFSSKLQAEQLLEMRERSHRQSVKHLEEQISNLRDRLNRELRAKRQQESDTSPNIFSDDLLDSRPVFDKSVRGVDVGGNSAYFNEAPNKRSTSPAKVISTRVTRHNTPIHQKTFSPKKSFRSSSRK